VSTGARDWAQHQVVKPATAKLLLLVLSDHENHETKRIFPSIERLCLFTSLDKKTVHAGLARLQEMKILTLTEERRGMLGRTKVYELNRDWGGPWIDKKGRIHEAGSRPENGTISRPENGSIQSTRKRVTEPSIERNLEEEPSTPMVPKGDEALGSDLFGGELVDEHQLVTHVMQRWNEMAARYERIPEVKVANKARIAAIEKRGKEGAAIYGSPIKAWDRAFEVIEASTYLCGEDPPGRNYSEPFAVWLDFVLRQAEFTRIIEGGYRATRTAETHDPITGRRFGPAEQAGRAAVRGIFAAGSEHGNGSAAGGYQEAAAAGSDFRRPLRSAFDQFRDDEFGRS
jgi:hypothetical protein